MPDLLRRGRRRERQSFYQPLLLLQGERRVHPRRLPHQGDHLQAILHHKAIWLLHLPQDHHSLLSQGNLPAKANTLWLCDKAPTYRSLGMYAVDMGWGFSYVGLDIRLGILHPRY